MIKHWIPVAPWAGRVARRGVEVIYAALSVSSTWRLLRLMRRFPTAGASGRVVYPSLHVYVGLQIASVGLGVLPVFVCLAPLG